LAYFDPVGLLREVETRYKRYLNTTFLFRDPALRESFEAALDDSGSLSEGPFIEGKPVFRTGITLKELCQELFTPSPDEAFLHALDGHHGRRPLYSHQEAAIREALQGGNVIVATGTGSGKTEAFLFPILLDLYREFIGGRRAGTVPGVRALILYPLNALANDQKERLRTIARRLKDGGSPFSFTFGEYIGATPRNAKDGRATQHWLSEVSELQALGEVVFREDMWKTPPDILLTNYSMLEYLLIRPDDSALFDCGASRHWKTLVMDEAHQYMGIRGTEMGMLIRRLKQRLREGGRKSGFRCIVTSATLADREGDMNEVAGFASTLFGEAFNSHQVITGQLDGVTGDPESRTELTHLDYRRVKDGFKGCLPSARADTFSQKTPVKQGERESLASVLLSDSRSLKLLDMVREPVRITDAAAAVFPELQCEVERAEALADIIWLLEQARDSDGEPLLTLRYHHFIRALEGAHISYYPRLAISLGRGSNGEGAKFEVAICRDCGQHYLVGRVRDCMLLEAVRDPASDDFGVEYFLPVRLERPVRSEKQADQEEPTLELEHDCELEQLMDGYELEGFNMQRGFCPSHMLCTLCGRIAETGETLGCGHKTAPILKVSLQESGADAPDELRKCAMCGKSSRDPVKEVIHGSEGPHSVVATALHSMLPEQRRKVLAFADGRQEAAFFAWYAQYSYESHRNRVYMLNAMKRAEHAGSWLSLNDLVHLLIGEYRARDVLGPAASREEIYRVAKAGVLSEVLSSSPRLSLEGVGLVRFDIQRPPWVPYPVVFTEPPWNLNPEQGWHLATLLFDTARADGAVSWPQVSGNEVRWDNLDTEIRQCWYTSGSPRSRKKQRSWAGKGARRAVFLARLLETYRGLSRQSALNEAVVALENLWTEVREADSNVQKDPFFEQGSEGAALNLAWWRFEPVHHTETVYKCDTCARISAVDAFGLCMRPRCRGKTEPVLVRDLPGDHYRTLYQSDFPGGYRAEEHTAQLDVDKAREYQRDFKNGDIHLLSSSTTFELGVDLGDLDTVFLRNVPPQPFNYVQRVGRAGRRPGKPGIAITYCRRNPHDLYHFTHPERMMSGRLDHAPATSIKNEKVILRHVTACCLCVFFQQHSGRFESVKALIGDFDNPSMVKDVRELIVEKLDSVEAMIKDVVPGEVWTDVGLQGHVRGAEPPWVQRVLGDDSELARAEKVACSEWRKLREFEEHSSKGKNYDDAKWASDRLKTLETQDVLSFLSRNAVIPKYGFPVDVVALEIDGGGTRLRTGWSKKGSFGSKAWRKYGVELNRSLSMAIAEYAPESKVIANKNEWRSAGLKTIAGLKWPVRKYRSLDHLNFFEIWDKAESETKGNGPVSPIKTYVVPEFGFVTGRQVPNEPSRRPARQYTTRPYFAGAVGPDTGTLLVPSSSRGLIELKRAFPGKMVELCEGRSKAQFWVCFKCGAGFSGESNYPGEHDTPLGGRCAGALQKVSLAHEFVTDVVELRFLWPFSSESSHAGETPGFTTTGVEEHVSYRPYDALWFSYSLAYALLAGVTNRLGIPLTDLNVTVRYSTGRPWEVHPLLVYDNVPAGAGLVTRLEDPAFMESCLKSAFDRVSGQCGCGLDSSCYGCLRSYRNQFAHDKLRRGPVKKYLEEVLAEWGEEGKLIKFDL